MLRQGGREFPMTASDSYIVVEKMIRLGEIVMSELVSLLDTLQEQGLITPKEHKALLELAKRLNRENTPPR
jgi:hypothetical protein